MWTTYHILNQTFWTSSSSIILVFSQNIMKNFDRLLATFIMRALTEYKEFAITATIWLYPENDTRYARIVTYSGTLIEIEFPNFSVKGSLIPQNLNLAVLHTFGARAPALAFRCWANLSIASYCRRAKGVSSCSNFLYVLPLSRYRRAELALILGTARNFVIFRLSLQCRLYRYRLHF